MEQIHPVLSFSLCVNGVILVVIINSSLVSKQTHYKVFIGTIPLMIYDLVFIPRRNYVSKF